MSHLIADYGQHIRQLLAFDSRSAQRLSEEIEAHLHDALEDAGSEGTEEAARRIIKRFGSPETIAVSYTREIFPALLKKTWPSGLIICALVALIMLSRRSLALMPDLSTLPALQLLVTVDSIGFRLALFLGAAAWIASLLSTTRAYTSAIACTLVAAVSALLVSTAAGLLIAMSTLGNASSWVALAPFAATLAACALLAVLVMKIRILKGYARLMDTAEQRSDKQLQPGIS
ncbi:MAG: permease prefix domain 1-containing protein [Beijerinckiaceae bacterium]